MTAVIVAAGSGRRFGGLKQFAKLMGKPLVHHSILTFSSVREIAEMILVVPPQTIEQAARNVLKLKLHVPISVIAGGRLRQDSVQNGLRLVRTTYVAVHDGVRPFVSAEMIRQGIDAVRRHKAIVFGIPVSDTVKRVRGKRVTSTISRADLFSIQTPEFFDVKILRDSYVRTRSRGVEFTDDAGVVEKAGYPVFLLPGDMGNVKITYRSQMYSVDKRLNRHRIEK